MEEITIELDTNITPELKEEGDLREFLHIVQGLRKKANLKPDQKIVLKIETDIVGERFLQKIKKELLKKVGVQEISFDKLEKEEEINVDKMLFKIAIA